MIGSLNAIENGTGKSGVDFGISNIEVMAVKFFLSSKQKASDKIRRFSNHKRTLNITPYLILTATHFTVIWIIQ